MSSKSQQRALAKQRSAYEVQVRDSLNTMSRYLTMHRPCLDEGLELQDGSIVEDIRKRGKLRHHQIIAWHKWWNVVTAAHGRTNGMCASYQEQVDTSSAGDSHKWIFNTREDIDRTIENAMPYIWITSAADEYQRLWEYLRHEERGLIEQLTRDYYRATGEREIHASTLSTLGTITSGYNDNRQAIAAGVSRIQALLNSVAQFYRLPIFLS